MIYTEQIEFSERIIEHLMNKEQMSDDLEGIVLGIYDKEMKKLSEKIMKSLSCLVAKRKIIETKGMDGKMVYQLLKDKKR